MTVYTRRGDDGSTGLFFGGRVPKDASAPRAYGAVDEAQAAIGLARAELGDDDGHLGSLLIGLSRDLWVVMAELATAPENRHKLADGQTRATAEMVSALERTIDDVSARFEPPTEFVLPGQTKVAAALDYARTMARRAEREALAAAGSDSQVIPYLNRLSDLLWTLARWQEGEALLAKDAADPHEPALDEPEEEH